MIVNCEDIVLILTPHPQHTHTHTEHPSHKDPGGLWMKDQARSCKQIFDLYPKKVSIVSIVHESLSVDTTHINWRGGLAKKQKTGL